MNKTIEEINEFLIGKTTEEIISYVIGNSRNPVITTNFRPYEVAILHAVTTVKPDINVIWCDTGYNTPDTYRHADYLINRLNLNIKFYVPKQTVGYRNIVMGIPDISDPNHKLFTQQVKLEPFTRAMQEHQPDVWFTNLRKGQTAFRDSIDMVSQDANGIVKVSPFYNFSDEDLDTYLNLHNLPNEHIYYDPTKVLENRECGLHK